jgi:hypothetical protein
MVTSTRDNGRIKYFKSAGEMALQTSEDACKYFLAHNDGTMQTLEKVL